MQRLFEIVYILMKQSSATAAELAARFEVSQRTIYRDVDTLSAAGIPVYATQGKGGGISLMESFVLNKSVLSEEEQREILSSLQGMLSVTPERTGEVLLKLSDLFGRTIEDWISVDFTDWAGGDAFNKLKGAILAKNVISFDYFNAYGAHTGREVEPLQLRFKHRAWYLYGYSRERLDFRLFKLSRMKNLRVLDASFERSDYLGAHETAAADTPAENLITLKLKIDESLAYRVYDEFYEWQIVRQPDGSFIVTAEYIEGSWVYGYILSYGPYAEVLEPAHMRHILREQLHQAFEKYL